MGRWLFSNLQHHPGNQTFTSIVCFKLLWGWFIEANFGWFLYMSQRSSFETAQRYLDGISQHLRLTTTYDAPLILIGNKVDLSFYRQDNSTKRMQFGTCAKSGELTVETNVQRQMSIIVLTRLFPRPFSVIFISFPFSFFMCARRADRSAKRKDQVWLIFTTQRFLKLQQLKNSTALNVSFTKQFEVRH